MTYTQSTGKTIQEAFENFHRRNPAVFRLIVKEAKKLVRRGRKRFSVKQITGEVRWEHYVSTTEETLFGKMPVGKIFKIGDQYTSRYSRLLVDQYPEMRPYIEQREIRSN